MIKITVETALAGIKQAIEEMGSKYRYQSQDPFDGCMYVHYESFRDSEGREVRSNETPGCLVGRVLINMGVPVSEFFEEDEENYVTALNTGHDASQALDRLESRGIATYTQDAALVLFAAQTAQDDRRSWGEALAVAEQRAEELSAINN